MAHDSSSDIGLGVGLTLTVVALAAAAWLAMTSPSATFESGTHVAAVPFAVAMTVGVGAVAAIHLLWGE
ncbi:MULTISPECIES: hypothetical protein [Halolamina]|uniref:Uncharacterized protein n=1 Tax=Halolamina pelagica TaxID=699431 RepID=A0A1I5P7H1_9EURY|nr:MULTISPECIES: hypothetical protein [Halolamina]NHX36668.1 hypothetical protein [Halolamina sp. R1-12]SFP29913.1 hypothetical protein SAMN05216277_102390 [Halolamina pelagica]